MFNSLRKLSFFSKFAAFLIFFVAITPSAVLAGCICSVTASGTGAQSICTSIGQTCKFDTASNQCKCQNLQEDALSSGDCNEAGFKRALGIGSTNQVDNFGAVCTSADPNTPIAQQVQNSLNPAASTGSSATGTTATPTTTASKSKSTTCDTSGYKASDDHGLLNGILPECAVCGQCGIADFMIVGDTIVKLLLGLSGSIMLLMIVYGGFLWLTSGGASGQVDKGKKVVVGAVIGLFIVFAAYIAVQFILEAMGVTGAATIFSIPFKR